MTQRIGRQTRYSRAMGRAWWPALAAVAVTLAVRLVGPRRRTGQRRAGPPLPHRAGASTRIVMGPAPPLFRPRQYPASRVIATLAMLCQMVIVPAVANPQLAKARNCMTCHQMDQKVVGPSFKDVAARYAGQKNAEARLVDKVLHGGTGVWGPVPKPAATNVSKQEAQILVRWILSGK